MTESEPTENNVIPTEKQKLETTELEPMENNVIPTEKQELVMTDEELELMENNVTPTKEQELEMTEEEVELEMTEEEVELMEVGYYFWRNWLSLLSGIECMSMRSTYKHELRLKY